MNEMQLQNERLLNMVENLPLGAVFVSGNIITMNRTAEKITGYKREELRTVEQWFNTLHREHAKIAREIYEDARSKGFIVTSGPLPVIHKDGSELFVEFTGYRYDDTEVWLMQNITQRMQYEKQLKDSENRLRAIMDNASESIVVINDAGIITDFNPASEELFGYPSREVIGHNVNMLMPSPYREQHDSYIANYLKTGKSNFGKDNKRQLPGLRKDGTIIPLELIMDRIDHLGLFCGIIRDLTKQKAMEKEVANICALEQERIGRDIHDGLGQQLTGLGMMLSSLKRDIQRDNAPYTDRLDEIIHYLQRAAQDSRAITRGLAPMSIETLGLEDAVRLLAKDVRKTSGINCVLEFPKPVQLEDNTVTIQIYRIIQEAVNNAVKHANPGNIVIRLSNLEQLEFSVTDDGHGLELQDKDFRDSIGIRIMRYRADIIGCRLDITSGPQGTVVRCSQVYSSLA